MKVVDRVTLQYLKKNKGRTWVTILGVMISAAMLSAIVIIVFSAQDMMLRHTISSGGQWETKFYGVPAENTEELRENEKLASYGISTQGRYAGYPGGEGANRPYLYVTGETNFEISNTRIVEGRLPQNDTEIIVSQGFAKKNAEISTIGSTILLEYGTRYEKQDDQLFEIGTQYSYGGSKEVFQKDQEKEYTVVGIFEAPDKENEAYAAYRAMYGIQEDSLTAGIAYDVTVDYHNYKSLGRKIYQISEELKKNLGASSMAYNTGLLGYSGITSNSSFMDMVYMLAGVIGLVVLIGSVSLIYNAFSISAAQRSRTYGMLASVGATRQQKRRSVFFEAACIGAVAIPLGLAAGTAGMAVTFQIINPLMREWLQEDIGLKLALPWQGIAAIVLFSAVMLLLSTWIPARHASRVSALDAIRQSKEFRIRRRDGKTSRLTRLLFGFEGELGLKNIKRNRRHYRATVISLAVSVLLFLSASSFSSYVKKANEMFQAPLAFEMSVSLDGESMDSLNSLSEELLEVEGAGSAMAVKTLRGSIDLPRERLGKELAADIGTADKTCQVVVNLTALDEKSFGSYLKEKGLSEDIFEGDGVKGILLNEARIKNGSEFSQVELLKDVKAGDKLDFTVQDAADEKKDAAAQTITLAAVEDGRAPYGPKYVSAVYSIDIMVRMEDLDALCSQIETPRYYVSGKVLYTFGENENLEDDVRAVCDRHNDVGAYVTNVIAEQKQSMDGVMIASIFLYGFVALIALAGMANIINTISTGMQLRRREFAMLQSVGMTPAGFRKMLGMEGLFYGIKALLYGLPLGLLASIGIYYILNLNFSFPFFIPAAGPVGAVLGVFVIVGITMLYAKKKATAASIVEALKDENA